MVMAKFKLSKFMLPAEQEYRLGNKYDLDELLHIYKQTEEALKLKGIRQWGNVYTKEFAQSLMAGIAHNRYHLLAQNNEIASGMILSPLNDQDKEMWQGGV